ncbi:hypothetical protein [Clostridium peptidivorans]|uniref:hypothetical protein n=1 Tax=Clostridium peptidivorans TaxID=100174 RepID=UPI000BE34F5E|nr:hypothetical protein [Clostridium peptidivorans]
MENEIFYSDKRFLELDGENQLQTKRLINLLEARYLSDLEWRGYTTPIQNPKRQFTFKNANQLYRVKVLATATIVISKQEIHIEVRQSEYTNKNPFVFSCITTDNELKKLVTAIENLLWIKRRFVT